MALSSLAGGAWGDTKCLFSAGCASRIPTSYTFPSMESRGKMCPRLCTYLGRRSGPWLARWVAGKGVRKEGLLPWSSGASVLQA